MATAADKIKANAERLRQKPAAKAPAKEKAATEAPAPARSSAGGSAVRQKNVRRTVDLTPAAHRALDGWQSTVADRLGLARVTGQEVLSALVDRLLSDDELAEHVTAVIAANRV
ncbi:hypothetical protein [Mycobacterium kubicae]|uniref:hypothetical protein n=1 Tax=Mycobacterium kubicae TaxID=120959 RepID=UPI0007FFA03C|nr:hypothetical protein [Mycobacterium kubicae]OBK51198.1 hypothetical protein A5657_18740 [Mycobacterium kubicae]